MTKIKVVDSIMGTGKTSWAIQFMNETEREKKFIYITPFLSEVERVRQSVTNRKFVTPENYGKGKLDNLKKLILNECDIVSTHALFKKADEEIIELIKASDYILILDEVMDVVEQYDLKKDDLLLLIRNEMLSLDEETGIVRWNKKSEFQNTRYDELKVLTKNENLIYFENTILFWTFPVSVFQAFTEVYVLTYLFEAQEQKYYYDLYKLNYEYKAVQKEKDGVYYLVNHCDKLPYDKEKIKSLINIYEGKLNNIGDDNSLSYSWYLKNKEGILFEKVQKNLYTYFNNNVRTPSKANMWTSFKDYESKLKGKRYTKGFVSHNKRATNEYQEKESLAYTINRYMNPYKYKFFKSRGVIVNEDLFAVSELIQWIWRSRIRKGESINLYIPSKRMRNLLRGYLESEL